MIGECIPLTTCIKNDLQSKLANALFEAHFVKGRDVADFKVLAEISEEVGLMSEEEVSFLGVVSFLFLVESSSMDFDGGITPFLRPCSRLDHIAAP